MNELFFPIAKKSGQARRAIMSAAALLVGTMFLGCGRAAPQVADSERAIAALRESLDAWKNGDSPQSLAARTPPIHVSDAEWEQGAKLLDYTIDSEQSAGFGWRCDVSLTVQAEDGQKREHPASYRIDTDPAIVVVHE